MNVYTQQCTLHSSLCTSLKFQIKHISSHNNPSTWTQWEIAACVSAWLISYSLNNSGESKLLKSFFCIPVTVANAVPKNLCVHVPRPQLGTTALASHAVDIWYQLILSPEYRVKLCVWLISHGLGIWCSRQVKEAIKQKDDVWSCPDGVCQSSEAERRNAWVIDNGQHVAIMPSRQFSGLTFIYSSPL